MAKRFLIFGIFITLLFGIQTIFSYSPRYTHPDLSEEAVKFFNKKSNNFIPEKYIDAIRKGSEDEDLEPRWINHFYDPQTGEGWTGEHWGEADKETVQKTVMNLISLRQDPMPSPEWAQSSKDQNVFALYGGDHSWQKAIYDYAQGKEKEAFESLGYIMHLIADSSVPAHTRNDSHPHILGDPGSPYEGWSKNYTNNNRLNIADDLLIQNAQIPKFEKLDDAFDYIAKYSNEYFFSEETIRDEKYNQPIILGYDKKEINGKDYFYAYTIKNNKYYLARTKSAITQGSDINNIKFTTDDSKILPDYFSRLSKKSVLANAGVIDLFFREVEKVKNNSSNLAPPIKLSKLDIVQTAIVSPVGELFRIGRVANKIKTSVANTFSAIKNIFQKPTFAPTQNLAGVAAVADAPPAPDALNLDEPQALSEDVRPPRSNMSVEESTPGVGLRDLAQQLDGASAALEQMQERAGNVNLPRQPATLTTEDLTPGVIEPKFSVGPRSFVGGGGSGKSEAQSAKSETNSNEEQIEPEPEPEPPLESSEEDQTRQAPQDTTPPDVSLSIAECSDSLATDYCLLATTTLNIVWSSTADDFFYFIINNNGAISTTTATSTTGVDILDNSTFTFSVSATDTAGNSSATSTRTAEISLMPVVINEIAWSGTAASSADEWIELYNRTSRVINLNGWVLYSETDMKPYINLTGGIPANGYYLIERTNDDTVSDIVADWKGSFGNGLSGGISKKGEILILSLASTTIDQTILTGITYGDWPGGDGKKSYKRYSMERYNSDLSGMDVSNWGTNIITIKNGKDAEGNNINGTPKARNSITYLIAEGASYISSDVALTKENSPYVVNGTIQVFRNDAVLSIEPGVVIKFYGTSGMRFGGNSKIIARGTASESIVFTSFRDDDYGGDLNGDATTTSPGAGEWRGIKIQSGNSGSNFDNVIFRYGGWKSGLLGKANLNIENVSASIDNSTFEYSGVYGLKLINSTSTVSNSIFRNNDAENSSAGLYVEGGGQLTINSNSFLNNTRGLHLFNSTAAVSSNNFASSTAEAIYSTGVLGEFINNSGSNNAVNGIVISGNLTSMGATTTLGVNALPYVIKTYNAAVVASSTLVIPDGIVFKSDKTLKVNGNLIINGENLEDIVFTSLYDDSVGGDATNDGDLISPGKGQWKGIKMGSGSYSDIKGATFSYAATALSYESSPINLSSARFFNNNLAVLADTETLALPISVDPLTIDFDITNTATTTPSGLW